MGTLSKLASLDLTDLDILKHIQEDCKRPLHAIGELVGLSAPSVMERIRKLEQAGIVSGYSARLDPQQLGFSLTAFLTIQARGGQQLEALLEVLHRDEQVQECHEMTGTANLLVKARLPDTLALKQLIDRIHESPAVQHLSSSVVLETRVERNQVPLAQPAPALHAIVTRKPRRQAAARRSNQGQR